MDKMNNKRVTFNVYLIEEGLFCRIVLKHPKELLKRNALTIVYCLLN